MMKNNPRSSTIIVELKDSINGCHATPTSCAQTLNPKIQYLGYSCIWGEKLLTLLLLFSELLIYSYHKKNFINIYLSSTRILLVRIPQKSETRMKKNSFCSKWCCFQTKGKNKHISASVSASAKMS